MRHTLLRGGSPASWGRQGLAVLEATSPPFGLGSFRNARSVPRGRGLAGARGVGAGLVLLRTVETWERRTGRRGSLTAGAVPEAAGAPGAGRPRGDGVQTLGDTTVFSLLLSQTTEWVLSCFKF